MTLSAVTRRLYPGSVRIGAEEHADFPTKGQE